jgi:hypothetical protein
VFQDGGLQHNNPASIAQWEIGFVWPHKPKPDFALSLGTGTSSVTTTSNSITKSQFYVRIFKSFMRNLDGEDAWKQFCNSVSPQMRTRFHRLNVELTGPEPSLNDALIILELKSNVLRTIKEDKSVITGVVDAMLASMFYFEVDTLPVLEQNGYNCHRYIFC